MDYIVKKSKIKSKILENKFVFANNLSLSKNSCKKSLGGTTTENSINKYKLLNISTIIPPLGISIRFVGFLNFITLWPKNSGPNQ